MLRWESGERANVSSEGPYRGLEISKTDSFKIPTRSYRARARRISCGTEAVGFEYDTGAIERPVPNIRENTSMSGVVVTDYGVFRAQLATLGL